MPDLDPRLEEAVHDASARFAQLWFGKAHEIEERINDPEQRWAILLAALRQIGWPKEEQHG